MRTPCSQQRTHEIQDTIFREHVLFSFFYSREKILCVYIFYWREKILYVDDFTTNHKNKKKVLKIRFLEYGGKKFPGPETSTNTAHCRAS